MARFTDLTEENHDRVVKLVRAGAYIAHAAAVAGLHPNTVHNWIKRGEESDEEPYASFASAIRAAQADDACEDIKQISDAAKKGEWRAAAWKLERKYPKLYSANGAVQEEVRRILAIVRHVCTPEQYAEVMKLLAET